MMTAGWRRRTADATIGALARLLVRVFFTELVVTGETEMPSRQPLVVVANHPNGLVDALVLMAASRRFPRFLGKSTLWRILPLRPFLALAGVVPVARASDTAATLSDTQRRRANDTAFARCRQVLRCGGVVAVFPEGVSHDEASLQALRSGAARIALGAASDDRVAQVQVVAAGINYDDKARFRSRVMVEFLSPRSIDPYVEDYRLDAPEAIDRLTRHMADDLGRATPEFPSREEADEMLYMADVVGRRPGWPATLDNRQQVAATLAHLADTDEGRREVLALRRQVADYRRALGALGLDDAEWVEATAADGPRRPGARWTRLVAPVIVGPIVVAGVAIHIVPYTAIKYIARVPGPQSMKATIKVFGSFGLYSLGYATLAGVLGRRNGWRAGTVALIGAPASGWIAQLSLERMARRNRSRRAFSALDGRPVAVADIGARRAALEDRVGRLLALAATDRGPQLSI